MKLGEARACTVRASEPQRDERVTPAQHGGSEGGAAGGSKREWEWEWEWER